MLRYKTTVLCQIQKPFLLSSARKFTKFFFFDIEVYNLALNQSSDFFCSLTHGCFFVQTQSEETSFQSPPVDYSNDCWTNLVSEIDHSDGALDTFNEVSGNVPISSTRNIRCNGISFYLNPKNWNEIPVQKSIVNEMIQSKDRLYPFIISKIY
jgi:hypothetical protein